VGRFAVGRFARAVLARLEVFFPLVLLLPVFFRAAMESFSRALSSA
jgi:hypothetical protein